MNDTGFPERSYDAMRQELTIHENAVEGEDLLADTYLDREDFCEASGLDSLQWDENLPSLRREWRKGRRDMLRRVLAASEGLEHYSYEDTPQIVPAPPASAPASTSPLGLAVDDFFAEHSRQWATKTIGQNRAYLNILLEYFGPDRLLGTITKQDANAVKKVLQSLPASRNTKPKLKAMPLMQVIDEPEHKKIAPKTINSHIQMFKSFFD